MGATPPAVVALDRASYATTGGEKVMNMEIRFPGGLVVSAELKGFTVRTDQSPAHGGTGSAPEPFDLYNDGAFE